jgi:fibronectin-binding autotransporter adhesin
MTLSGANAYTGVTNINTGTLVVTNASVLGTTAGNTVVGVSGSLRLNGGITGGKAIDDCW